MLVADMDFGIAIRIQRDSGHLEQHSIQVAICAAGLMIEGRTAERSCICPQCRLD